MKKLFYAIIFSAMAFCSCKEPAGSDFTTAFLAQENVACVVGSRQMINFSTGIVQTDYNPTIFRYRAGVGIIEKDGTTGYLVEIVKEYFVLTLEEAIPQVEQEVKGKLVLRTNALNREYNGTFKVLKSENSLCWLWDDALKLGVIVRTGGNE